MVSFYQVIQVTYIKGAKHVQRFVLSHAARSGGEDVCQGGQALLNARSSNPRRGRATLPMPPWESWSRYYHTRCREVVHCIEIEPELQAAIRGKGYPLVGTDFLTFWPDEKYDLIIMNPPFASGEAHLLHAWEILDHGDIVCLLNEQTLLNPCTVQTGSCWPRSSRSTARWNTSGSCFRGGCAPKDAGARLDGPSAQEAGGAEVLV